MFVKHSGERLVLVLSVHVDDLKMTGEEDQLNLVLKVLTEHFDELKVEKTTLSTLDSVMSLNQMVHVVLAKNTM